MKTDFRQPLHFDGGPLWYSDDSGNLWSPLSTITNINDGVGTYVCGNPVAGIFEEVLKIVDDFAAGNHVLKHLRQCEKESKVVGPNNRAGQILSFHPGEQVHCGMGYDGRVDPLTPGLLMRVVLFLCFVPERFYRQIWNLNMFASEYAWGLMKYGVQRKGLTEQVKQKNYTKSNTYTRNACILFLFISYTVCFI
jgi:hypothetical protein